VPWCRANEDSPKRKGHFDEGTRGAGNGDHRAASGIGAGAASALAQQSIHIASADLDAARLAVTAAQLRRTGAEVVARVTTTFASPSRCGSFACAACPPVAGLSSTGSVTSASRRAVSRTADPGTSGELLFEGNAAGLRTSVSSVGLASAVPVGDRLRELTTTPSIDSVRKLTQIECVSRHGSEQAPLECRIGGCRTAPPGLYEIGPVSQTRRNGLRS